MNRRMHNCIFHLFYVPEKGENKLMNLITESGTMTTTIVANEDKTKVFETCRECSGSDELGEAILITLFPTTKNMRMDLSSLHTLNHMEELGLKKIHFLYLFGKVCSARLSTRGIVADEENLSYVEEALLKYKNAKVIIGWGNSMGRSAVAIDSKKRILAMVQSREDNQLWQLGCAGVDFSENVHPLFLGIRQGGKHCRWELNPYEIPEELKTTEEDKEPKKQTGNVVAVKRTGRAKQAEKKKK